MKVRRLIDAPIISAATDANLGENIQGPSLVRVPDWVDSLLGRYYLYFADHTGKLYPFGHARAVLSFQGWALQLGGGPALV
ncbi:MAG TPA: hypothetical protein EYQ54_07340 [Myxococcales bacterium]|nr:hypothetical protein [Myxococcales bacterium]